MTFLQIIIGAGFRIYESVAQSMKWKTKECWKINRGDLSPVMSCEGNGDPGVNFTIILCAAFLLLERRLALRGPHHDLHVSPGH